MIRRNLNEYKTISYDYQKGNRVHAVALQCLMMNAADLSDQLKDWGSVKKTAVCKSVTLIRLHKNKDFCLIGLLIYCR